MYLIFQRTKILNISNVELVRTIFPAVCVADRPSVVSKAEVEVVGKVKESWPTKDRLQEGCRAVGKSLGLCHLWPSKDVNFYEYFPLHPQYLICIYCVHIWYVYIISYIYISASVYPRIFFSLVHPRDDADLFCTSEEREEMCIFFLDMFNFRQEIPLYLWLHEVVAKVGGNPWLFQWNP